MGTHLTKTSNGFTIAETNESFIFQPFAGTDGVELQYHIVSTYQGFFGTDLGIIVLNTDCTIDEITYPNMEEFVVALYA